MSSEPLKTSPSHHHQQQPTTIHPRLDRMNSASFKSSLRGPSSQNTTTTSMGPPPAYRRSSVRIRRTEYDAFDDGHDCPQMEDIDIDHEINEYHLSIQRKLQKHRNTYSQVTFGSPNYIRPHSDSRYQYYEHSAASGLLTSPERQLPVFKMTPLIHTNSSSALVTLSPTGGHGSAGSSLGSGILTPDDELGSADLEIDIKASPTTNDGKTIYRVGHMSHLLHHGHNHRGRMGRRATTAVEGSCRSISASDKSVTDDNNRLFLSVNSLLSKQARSSSSSNFLEVPSSRKVASNSGSSSCCQTTHSSPTRDSYSYSDSRNNWQVDRRFAGVKRGGLLTAEDGSSGTGSALPSDDDEGFTSDSVNHRTREKRSHSHGYQLQPHMTGQGPTMSPNPTFQFVRRKYSDRTADRTSNENKTSNGTSNPSSGGLSPASPLGSVNISIMLANCQGQPTTANMSTQTPSPSASATSSLYRSLSGRKCIPGQPRSISPSMSVSPASGRYFGDGMSSGQWTPVSNTSNTIRSSPCVGHIDMAFPRSFGSFTAPGGEVKKYPFILQRSLFPNVSPTIYFGSEDEDGKIVQLPRDLQKQYFRWKLSSITPTLIRETVIRSGFRLLKEKTKTKKWLGTWCKHIKSVDFALLSIEYNKVNHFPGSFHLGRKDKLWFNLQDKSSRFGESIFSDFHPMTYVLPQDLKALRRTWLLATGDGDWKMILKPPASARGNGITVINKWSQIPKSAKVKKRHHSKPLLIAQEYIANPCLLFNESKFDLRVYVLVTSFHPLRIYIYEDGLVRFASEKYSSKQESLSDPFIHLTNYSINKANQSYRSNNEPGSKTGHKWSLNTLWKYLNEMSIPELNVDNLKAKINDMIIKTLISCEDQVTKLIKRHTKSRYSCYELLGFDIMIDGNFKPWLLEVNISPSLRSESSLDSTIKGNLIKDMLNLVGYRLPVPVIKAIATKVKKSQEYTVDPDCFPASSIASTSASTPLPSSSKAISPVPSGSSSSIVFSDDKFFSVKLSREEKAKHMKYEEGQEATDTILDSLTPDDVRILIESEDEFSRRGHFHRIFPGSGTDRYMKYFDENRYYNILLFVWGNKYDDDPARGIELLQSLARERFHLKNRSDGSILDRLLTKWKGMMRRAALRQLFKTSDQSSDATELGDDEPGTIIPG